MVPTTANPPRRHTSAADGIHQAFGVAVLTTTTTGISRIVVFGDPDLIAKFGFLPVQTSSAGP